ncbi:MAG: FecR domain-containing protein [Bacteroidia bacterium]|nr:FecR domain-containing protein [Bacteroidia bacterium]
MSKELKTKISEKENIGLFPEIDLDFPVSKEEVWNNLMNMMDRPKQSGRKISVSLIFRFALAASLLLLVGITSFFRLYSKTVESKAGEHLAFTLPDDSYVELNAGSSLWYHPYWFNLSGTVNLDGEAFFKVSHGSQFKVHSNLGETTVLGTSFNIFSRLNEYNVTCFTGKVRVVSSRKTEIIFLNPNEQTYISKEGDLHLVKKVKSASVISWRDNKFFFTGASVISVIQEIERQYNIKIQYKADPGLTYTGNFSKTLSEKEVLDLVCTSLGLTFESSSKTEFRVN